MPFSKSFPKTLKGSPYPEWVEVSLKETEEKAVEELARKTNNALMKECILDAKKIMEATNLKDYQSDQIELAKSLFDKRASHVAFWKEEKCKEKFEMYFKNQ